LGDHSGPQGLLGLMAGRLLLYVSSYDSNDLRAGGGIVRLCLAEASLFPISTFFRSRGPARFRSFVD
jgi:hypothetical protein